MIDTISALCVNDKSIYKSLLVDCWDKARDAYNFRGSNPVIAHPPCQQWSKLRAFAKVDQREKDLSVFCWEVVKLNGGIFEHPAGSSFFEYIGEKKIYSVNQFWFGFPAAKRTYLFFSKCKPIAYPVRFDAVEKRVEMMKQKQRSRTTLDFANWLIGSIESANINLNSYDLQKSTL